jgi:hypothetical protein
MKHQADKKHSERSFVVGDKVYLKLQPYVQASLALRANRKLAFKFFGPYVITEKIGAVAYKLALPPGAAIHPVFHVSLLKKAVPATEQVVEAIPDANVAFQIPEQVLQYHTAPGSSSQTEVLIKWSGMPSSLATWEKLDYLKQQFPPAPALGHASSFPGGMSVLLHFQPVELAKDWRSDCLEKQNLLNGGICGVLGRLHSSHGLAHSSNNAKLNDSAKHETNAAGNK